MTGLEFDKHDNDGHSEVFTGRNPTGDERLMRDLQGPDTPPQTGQDDSHQPETAGAH